MFRNYLKIAFRSLRKSKGFTAKIGSRNVLSGLLLPRSSQFHRGAFCHISLESHFVTIGAIYNN